jgi:hypothetical protein
MRVEGFELALKALQEYAKMHPLQGLIGVRFAAFVQPSLQQFRLAAGAQKKALPATLYRIDLFRFGQWAVR